MDKKTLAHVIAEAAVVGSLAIYLLNQNSKLEARISQLEQDVIVLGKKTFMVETTGHRRHEHPAPTTNFVRPSPAEASPQPRQPKQPIPTPQTKPKAKPKAKPRVVFSDENDDDEQSGSSHSDEEEIEEESEEEAPPPVTLPKQITSRGGKKPGRGKVKIPATTPANASRKDMGDVRSKAEQFRREAEAE